ncbi:MAG: hypothetical protein FWC27_13210 [Firmicutes bacterium]|nr:hypothetical protein [Bacillota bacterium]
MTLEALGRQYAAEADNLAGMIESCKERSKAALCAGNSREAARQESLVESHELQRSDLLEIAANLRHYYDDSGDGLEQQTTMKGKLVHI